MFKHAAFSINIHGFGSKRKFISFGSLRDIILPGTFYATGEL